MVTYLDMTPKWEELLPSFLAVLESGTPEGKEYIKGELARALRGLDELSQAMKPKPFQPKVDLIEAYEGYYEGDLPSGEAMLAKIAADTPAERLRVFLEWNGIIGYHARAFAIANGEG